MKPFIQGEVCKATRKSRNYRETLRNRPKDDPIRVKMRNDANARMKEFHNKWRAKAVSCLGGICCKCGFTDARALQIDHVNGDGWKEKRRSFSQATYYKKVIQEVEAASGKYQLLCANCNWIKRFENKEHRRI